MTWFAWQGLNNNKAVNLVGLDEKFAVADGFHGYGTEALAEANPNSVNNPITKIEAESFIPGTTANNPTNAIGNAVSNSLGLGNLGNISGLISDILNGAFWLRVAEGALGIVLIAVSLSKLSGVDNPISKAIP